MLILRCTKKLLHKKPGPADSVQDSLVPRLGHWHANLIRVGCVPVVLAINDATLLPILLPGNHFNVLLPAFRRRLGLWLLRLGVSPEKVAMESAAMAHISVDRTNNRSVLGSMNDFANQLGWQAHQGLDIQSPTQHEDDLADTPMSALQYASPQKAARAALLVI